ncbi:MAG: polysaccharide deacetylase family protein [Breznakiellaceae bacterium]
MILVKGPVFSDEGKVIILDYHTFLGNGKSSLDFNREELIRQLEQFEKMGFRFVSLDDAIQGKISGWKNLIFTIDDGNHSVPPIVRDVLLPRGIVPVLFISAALTERSQFCFNPSVLKGLYEKGCIIGAHGYTHQYLTKRAFATNSLRSREEIEKPGPLIEQWIGKKPLYFAYPYGRNSPQAKALLSQVGYRYAFLADDKVHPISFDDPNLDPYEVPRTIMYWWNVKKVFAQLGKYGAFLSKE